VEDYATVDRPPKMEQRRMSMFLAARKDLEKKEAEKAAENKELENKELENKELENKEVEMTENKQD